MAFQKIGSRGEKLIPIFILLDCSGSLSGRPFESIHQCLVELASRVKEIDNDNVGFRFAVYAFAETGKWIDAQGESLPKTPNLSRLKPGAFSDYNSAFLELNKKLDPSSGFLLGSDKDGLYPPFVLLIGDLCPTSSFQAGLDALNKNPYFLTARRFAYVFGEEYLETAKSMFSAFTDPAKIVLFPEDDIKKLQMDLLSTLQIFGQDSSSAPSSPIPPLIKDNEGLLVKDPRSKLTLDEIGSFSLKTKQEENKALLDADDFLKADGADSPDATDEEGFPKRVADDRNSSDCISNIVTDEVDKEMKGKKNE
jgi:uncharacterized protein YegL